MKKNLVLISIILVIIIAFVIYLNVKSKSDHYKRITLSTANHITNRTDMKYLDTIVSIGMDELAIGNTFIVIRTLSPGIIKSFDDQYNLKACIQGNGNQFMIYIKDDVTRNEALLIMSHELIHLKQLHSGDFYIKPDGMVVWKNTTIDASKVSYEFREWEIDAFNKQSELKDSIRKRIIL